MELSCEKLLARLSEVGIDGSPLTRAKKKVEHYEEQGQRIADRLLEPAGQSVSSPPRFRDLFLPWRQRIVQFNAAIRKRIRRNHYRQLKAQEDNYWTYAQGIRVLAKSQGLHLNPTLRELPHWKQFNEVFDKMEPEIRAIVRTEREIRDRNSTGRAMTMAESVATTLTGKSPEEYVADRKEELLKLEGLIANIADSLLVEFEETHDPQIRANYDVLREMGWAIKSFHLDRGSFENEHPAAMQSLRQITEVFTKDDPAEK